MTARVLVSFPLVGLFVLLSGVAPFIPNVGGGTTAQARTRTAAEGSICHVSDYRDTGGIASDATGNIYLAYGNASGDPIRAVVEKYAPDGRLLLTMHTGTRLLSSRYNPDAVTVDAHGNVYVADRSSSRVVKFSPSGRRLAAWGKVGAQRGQFIDPSGLAFDKRGRLLVLDQGNQRVQVLNSRGTVVGVWKKSLHAATQTQPVRPNGIATAPKGRVYVSMDSNQLTALSPKGHPLFQTVYVKGSELGQFMHMSSLAVGPTGNVYVADRLNCRVQVKTTDGTYLSWVLARGPAGEGVAATGVALAPDGKVYAAGVIRTAESTRLDVQVLSSTGTVLRSWLVGTNESG